MKIFVSLILLFAASIFLLLLFNSTNFSDLIPLLQEMIVIHWQNYQITINFFLICIIITLFVVFVFFCVSCVAKLTNLPGLFNLKQHKNYLEALVNFNAMLEEGDYKNAKNLKKYIEKKSDNVMLISLVNLQFAKSFDNSEIIKILCSDLLKTPELKQIALRNLIEIAYKENHWDNCMNLMMQFDKSDTICDKIEDIAWLLPIKAESLIYKRNFEHAISVLKNIKKYKIHNNNYNSNRYLALSLVALAQENHNIKLIDEAIKITPDNLGICLVKIEILQHNRVQNNVIEKQLFKFYKQFSHVNIIELYISICKRDDDIIAKVKQITKHSNNTILNNFAIAKAAFIAKDYELAYKQSEQSISEKKTRHNLQLIADIANDRCEFNKSNQYLKELVKFAHLDRWICCNCHNHHNDWHFFCNECNKFDSIFWIAGL